MIDVKADFGVLPIPILGAAPLVQRQRELPGELELQLPSFEYQTRKFVPVPFDRRTTDGKFDNINQAMQFVFAHCVSAHGRFDRQLAKLYIGYCQVFNFVDGCYVCGSQVPKSVFDNAFRMVAGRNF